MELKITNHICSKSKPLFIAEEGQANQGDINLALKMIDLASQSGADGIEFQLFWAEDMYIKTDPGFDYYKQNELSEKQICSLIQHTHKKRMLFQAACLSPRMVEFCRKEGADTFVVNATDLNNPEILDAVAESSMPFWLATLMGTDEEINWAVNYLKRQGADNFGILHGQHVMSSDRYQGVPPQMAQLGCISWLEEKYGLPVGYVDHTPTIQMPALAVARGAVCVTKHLAPAVNWKGPDWSVALSPDDWKKSQQLFRYSVSTGGASKELSQLEFKDRAILRRGIYTKNSIEKGQQISRDDLIALRPGPQAMNPIHIEKLLGKKAIKFLDQYHNISMYDVE